MLAPLVVHEHLTFVAILGSEFGPLLTDLTEGQIDYYNWSKDWAYGVFKSIRVPLDICAMVGKMGI